MNLWGFYQKECHRLLNECFDSKGKGYVWLQENFGVNHFSDLRMSHKSDQIKLKDIYDKLLVKSITEI
jgi:hypothetical protein